MTREVAAFAVMVALGCAARAEPLAPEPEDELPLRDLSLPASSGGLGRGVDARLTGEQRPEIVASFTFDGASLPELEPTPVRSAPLPALSVSPLPSLRVETPSRWSAQAKIGDIRLPATAPLPPGITAPCPRSLAGQKVEWETLDRDSWQPASVTYHRYVGSVDGTACRATANEATRVTATAIVPSLLYGFRACDGPCDDSKPSVLHVLGPPSSWSSSSSPSPKEQLEPQNLAFSHVRVPLAPGGSASVWLGTTQERMASFVSLHREVNAFDDDGQRVVASARHLQLGVDFIWPSGEDRPTALAYLAGPGISTSRPFLERIGAIP